MRLSKIFTGAVMAATAFAAVIPRADPPQIAAGITKITDLSQDLRGPAQSITLLNAPLVIVGEGPFPTIIQGFKQIVTTATVLTKQTQETPPITVEDEVDMVFEAFRGFVRVTQTLLNILIDKASILTKVAFIGKPVAKALRSAEGVIDRVAAVLANTCESRGADFKSQADSLHNTFELCIKQYEGLSVS